MLPTAQNDESRSVELVHCISSLFGHGRTHTSWKRERSTGAGSFNVGISASAEEDILLLRKYAWLFGSLPRGPPKLPFCLPQRTRLGASIKTFMVLFKREGISLIKFAWGAAALIVNFESMQTWACCSRSIAYVYNLASYHNNRRGAVDSVQKMMDSYQPGGEGVYAVQQCSNRSPHYLYNPALYHHDWTIHQALAFFFFAF